MPTLDPAQNRKSELAACRIEAVGLKQALIEVEARTANRQLEIEALTKTVASLKEEKQKNSRQANSQIELLETQIKVQQKQKALFQRVSDWFWMR